MPRIRKKTTKRGTTNQREKIKHKVAETRKKRKKESKKVTQWKTKNPKDPGIPNNFPYKDQILAEVAEERRKAAEEKERRKEEKRAAKAKVTADEDGADDSGSEAGFESVRSINASKREKLSTQAAPSTAEVEDAEEVPVLFNRDLPTLKSVLDLADVVIEVLDARDPLLCRSLHIEEVSEGKKTLLVLNKIDVCPREAVSSWAGTLRSQHPTVLFRSASAFLPSAPEQSGKGKGKERANDAWGAESIKACLQQWRQEKGDDVPLVVAVVGVTNAGKSSLINSVLGKAALSTYNTSAALDGPTTTAYPQEVSLEIDGQPIRFIDTPGLAWCASEENTSEEVQHLRARDILLRNRGRVERLKDPAPVVAELVSRADREDLMLFYNLPAFADGDANAFLSGVARSNGLIKKGAVLDLAGASRIVLRDWSTGKFPRYTVPPSAASSPPADAAFADIYAKDEDILSRLATRKEMRKAGGVVKLKTGEPEARKAVLDASWAGDENNSGSDGDEESQEDDADEGASDDVEDDEMDEDDDDDEDEEEDSEDEEEDAPLPPPGKRKRSASKVAPAPARPAKKVAFAADPKESKQARSAAGAKGSHAAARKAKVEATVERSDDAAAKPKAKSSSAAKPAQSAKERKAPVKQASAVSSTKKVANSSAKKLPLSSAKTGEEAYDFKQFF